MTQDDVQTMLSEMTDSELLAALEVAKTDLVEAANEQPNSEWHQACFAGLLAYAEELRRRGITLATVR